MVASSLATVVVELVAHAWSTAVGFAHGSTLFAPMSRVTRRVVAALALRNATAAATWLDSG